MSCCNQKRTELSQPSHLHSNTTNTGSNMHQVSFQYIGKTALSATGNITGRKYHFQRTGDIQLVDYRDVAGIATVPVLKRV